MRPPTKLRGRALAILTATTCAVAGLTAVAPQANAAANHLIINEV